MIKLAIFDLGNVVFDAQFNRAYAAWAERISHPVGTFHDALLVSDEHWDFERGLLSPQQFYAHFCDVSGVQMSFDDFRAGWCAIYGELIPQTLEGITRLKPHMPVVALTNTNALHCEYWQPRYRDALALFDTVYISNEIGLRKPDPECFTYVLQRHAVRPEETIFFDDNRANIAAAQSLGIAAFPVRDPEAVPRALRELGLG
jgi:putative hydrolase of the HAD superfamily